MKKMIDAPIAQLIRDLEARGLLDRTLVVLASEFGRDAVTEGKVGKEVKDQAINIPDVMTEPRHYGMHRHFTAAGSVLMFGGGVKKGFVYGKTADERPCTTIENPVPVEHLHASIFHALGIPPTRPTPSSDVPSTSRRTASASRSRRCSAETARSPRRLRASERREHFLHQVLRALDAVPRAIFVLERERALEAAVDHDPHAALRGRPPPSGSSTWRGPSCACTAASASRPW